MLLMITLFAKAKVSEDNVPIRVQEQVLRLQVTVNNALRMQVAQGGRDLGGVEPGPRLGEDALPLQVEEELAAVDVVEDKVELLPRLERVVEADEERVLEVLDEHVALGHDVVGLAALDDGLLGEDLDGVDLEVALAASQEDLPVAALPDHL